MAPASPSQKPSPDRIFGVLDASQSSAARKTGQQNPNAHIAAAFSLIMLAGADSGEAYTFSQYEKMFRNAGFVRTTEHAVPAIASLGEIGNPREEKKQANH